MGDLFLVGSTQQSTKGFKMFKNIPKFSIVPQKTRISGYPNLYQFSRNINPKFVLASKSCFVTMTVNFVFSYEMFMMRKLSFLQAKVSQ